MDNTKRLAMLRFDFIPAPLAGLMLVQRKATEDQRGFLRFYCAGEIGKVGLVKCIAQINHTLTGKKGAVRGLHFQYPRHAGVKLVSCLKIGLIAVKSHRLPVSDKINEISRVWP